MVCSSRSEGHQRPYYSATTPRQNLSPDCCRCIVLLNIFIDEPSAAPDSATAVQSPLHSPAVIRSAVPVIISTASSRYPVPSLRHKSSLQSRVSLISLPPRPQSPSSPNCTPTSKFPLINRPLCDPPLTLHSLNYPV